MNNVHILNGDALYDRFPDIVGEKIILRECLIEGNATGDSWNEFISNRTTHIQTTYGDSKNTYQDRVVEEFRKIKHIKDKSDVYFWLEDDLFCQVNFWFSCSLVAKKATRINLFFIRAKSTQLHGFGGMSKVELTSSFDHPIVILPAEIEIFTKLWNAYRVKDIDELLTLKAKLSPSFSFVQHSIESASKMAAGKGETFSYFEKLLLKIMQKQESPDFRNSFQEFSKQASILGLGDLQVKRMYDKVIQHV